MPDIIVRDEIRSSAGKWDIEVADISEKNSDHCCLEMRVLSPHGIRFTCHCRFPSSDYPGGYPLGKLAELGKSRVNTLMQNNLFIDYEFLHTKENGWRGLGPLKGEYGRHT